MTFNRSPVDSSVSGQNGSSPERMMLKQNASFYSSLFFLIVCAAYPFFNAFSAAPIVEALPESEIQYTCGCNFQFITRKGHEHNETTFLQWAYGEDAMMRIDGKLVRLKVKETGGSSKNPSDLSVGDREKYELSNGEWLVKVRTTTTQVCKPETSGCEAYGLRARIQLMGRKDKVSFDATGACGC